MLRSLERNMEDHFRDLKRSLIDTPIFLQQNANQQHAVQQQRLSSTESEAVDVLVKVLCWAAIVSGSLVILLAAIGCCGDRFATNNKG